MKLASVLDPGPDATAAITEFSVKGLGPLVPTDPLISGFGPVDVGNGAGGANVRMSDIDQILL